MKYFEIHDIYFYRTLLTSYSNVFKLQQKRVVRSWSRHFRSGILRAIEDKTKKKKSSKVFGFSQGNQFNSCVGYLSLLNLGKTNRTCCKTLIQRSYKISFFYLFHFFIFYYQLFLYTKLKGKKCIKNMLLELKRIMVALPWWNVGVALPGFKPISTFCCT